MQVLSKKTCARGVYFKGKSFGEVPMAILELFEYPKIRGYHTPKSSVMILKVFAHFPKMFAPITKKFCLHRENFLSLTAA